MAKHWWVSKQGMRKQPNGADSGRICYSYYLELLQNPMNFCHQRESLACCSLQPRHSGFNSVLPKDTVSRGQSG